jgi:polysaccharide export outer membrane protein
MKIVEKLLFLGLLASCAAGLAQQNPQRPATLSGAAAAPQRTSVAAPSTAQEPAGPAPQDLPASAPDLSPSYVLGPEDAIHVNVWKEPTLTGPLLVRPDGKISLPLVGDVTAAGKTPMALAREIATALKQYINDPTVTVTVTAVNSKRVFFIGEVNHAGPLPLTRDMSLLQAISAAGGLTPYASKKHIYILRGEPGKQQKIKFDYTKALKTGNEQGIKLLAGDTIVVP